MKNQWLCTFHSACGAWKESTEPKRRQTRPSITQGDLVLLQPSARVTCVCHHSWLPLLVRAISCYFKFSYVSMDVYVPWYTCRGQRTFLGVVPHFHHFEEGFLPLWRLAFTQEAQFPCPLNNVSTGTAGFLSGSWGLSWFVWLVLLPAGQLRLVLAISHCAWDCTDFQTSHVGVQTGSEPFISFLMFWAFF